MNYEDDEDDAVAIRLVMSLSAGSKYTAPVGELTPTETAPSIVYILPFRTPATG